MRVKIEIGWHDALADQWEQPYFAALTDYVRAQYGLATVYPPPGRIFAAFDACPFDDVKVVIIGQDPYHGPGQANGLCFSVSDGIAMPPSLVNIFKEIMAEEGKGELPLPASGNLEYLARQGVLLLNATLTVEAHRAGSHQGRGWETFTDAAIRALNARRSGIVYMLWGSYAIRKASMIDSRRNLVLTSPHPSPLSAYRGFFGNGHFAAANNYLAGQGKNTIQWLPESLQ